MSSYFDFYCKNVNNGSKTESIEHTIRGACYSMCPKVEVDLRVREHMVHVLEAQGSALRLVKSYSRSAADSNMAVPHLLRPYHVLKDTVKYLLVEIMKRQDVSILVVYDFVNDRLRAVRQDMTIQRLPPEECAALLEPMVRFYVYFGYRLRNYPISDFDPVLNKKYLLESLKWFLYCCDVKKTEGKEGLDTFMEKLSIGEKKLKYDRALMESVYILCNMEDVHPLLRYLELPKELKVNVEVELAYKIAIANLKGNFIVVFRELEKLCPLSYCAICPHLPVLQRRALLVLSHAYSSKQLRVPRGALQRWLRPGGAPGSIDVRGLCLHYGITTEGDDVRFNKADFKTDAPLHQSMNLLHEDKLNQQIEDLFITCN